jgi:uncharacterized protein YndB with AHSA1/START domain
VTTTTQTNVATTQVYRVYIKTTPQAIWDAITRPEWTEKYGYGGLVDYNLAGGPFRIRPDEVMKRESAANGYEVPDVIVDGEVVEADPPRKLVLTWRMLMDEGMAAEGFTRLIYEIEEATGNPGVCKLTVTHELPNAPALAHMVAGGLESEGAGGGWAFVLSDLKSLLETGSALGR